MTAKVLRIGDTQPGRKAFQLPLDAATETFGILAKKGAGKSNAAVVMAEAMWDAAVPWVAIDPKGDWWGIRSSRDGKAPGLALPVFGGQHGDVPLEPGAGALVADLVVANRMTCVLDVSEFTAGEMRRFLLAFGQRLFRASKAEPLHVFLEEAHEYLPQVVRAPDAEVVGAWQKIVKQGRTRGLGVTMVSQRSAALNKDVLTQIDTLIVLRTMSPQDRAAVKGWVDTHADAAAMLDTLPTLANGEAWVWSPEFLGVLERIKFHQRRTFDSGATPKVGQVRRPPATLADVDLGAITAAMADTIEKAKADDPKELRRTIAALRAELADRPRPEPVIERVPFVPDEAVVALRSAVQIIDDHIQAATVVREAIGDALGVTKLGQILSTPPDRTSNGTSGRTTMATKSLPPQVAAPERADTSGDTNGSLPVGESKILTAVAQYPDGATREQLTVLTGYKRSSRDAYIQRLRVRGLVTISPSAALFATEAGIAALGDAFQPLPTGKALRDHWLATLPTGEAAILECLIVAYPDPMDRDRLSDRTGYKRSSRDAYLQRLRARQLVTIQDGDPRAADVLFDKAMP